MQSYGRERPKEGLIVHTDQGSQFTSGNFQALLRTHRAVAQRNFHHIYLGKKVILS